MKKEDRIKRKSQRRKLRHIRRKLGPSGRMICWDTDTYVKEHPNDEVVFNANLCMLTIQPKRRKLWYGDLNLTKENDILQEIADFCREPIYILSELDGRYEYEKDPQIDRAIKMYNPEKLANYGSKSYLIRNKSGSLQI